MIILILLNTNYIFELNFTTLVKFLVLCLTDNYGTSMFTLK